MKFDTMDQAIEYLLESTPGGEVVYKSAYYSCVVGDTCKMHATLRDGKHKHYFITGETWENGRDPEEPYHEMTRKEVCRLAFIKLRNEDRKDAALRLASHIIDGGMFTLGLSDTDFEIQDALKQCGHEPVTVSSYRAMMSLEGAVRIPDYIYRRLKVEFYD